VRLYLDACPVIYLVQQVQPWFSAVDRRLREEDVEVVVSDLTRLECRVKPLRDGDQGLLEDFEEFFRYAVAEVVPLSTAAVDRATEIRARYGFKAPDAIHLGAAQVSKCDDFLTNDHRLDGFPDMALEVLARA